MAGFDVDAFLAEPDAGVVTPGLGVQEPVAVTPFDATGEPAIEATEGIAPVTEAPPAFNPDAFLTEPPSPPSRESLSELERDSLEDLERPSIGQIPLNILVGAGKQGKEIAGSVINFVKHPKEAAIKFGRALKSISPRDVPKIVGAIGLDIAEDIGYTPERGFDIDTLINKWQDRPLSVLGDAFLLKSAVNGIAKKVSARGAASTVAKATKQEARVMADIVKKSGISLGDIGSDISDLRRASQVAGAKSLEITPWEHLLNNSKNIRKIMKSSKKLSFGDNLGNVNWMRRRSQELGEKLQRVRKLENAKLKAIVNQAGDATVAGLKSKVDDTLVNLNVLEKTVDKTGKTITRIAPNVKKEVLVNKVRNRLAQSTPMKAREVKTFIDELDDAINYANPKVPDRAMIGIRRTLRKELGGLPGQPGGMFPEYGQVADRIHENLTLLNVSSKKLAQPGFKENFGKSVLNSLEKKDNFLKIVESIPDKSSAASILGTLDNLEAWQAWNASLGQHLDFLPSFLSVGVGSSRLPLATAPLLGTVIKQGAGVAISPVGQAVGKTLKGAARGVGEVIRPRTIVGAGKIQSQLETIDEQLAK